MTHGDDSQVGRHRVDASASEDELTIQGFLQAAPTAPARPKEPRRLASSLYQPRRRGRPVEPLQRFGDRRPVQFERGDHRGELGPDVGRHQVGQVARLGHEITLRKERPSGRGRFARP
jgi:hypothetical protein